MHKPVSEPLSDFAKILGQRGVVEGLEFLNARVEHRCTGIYQMEDLTLRSVYLYDRRGELLPESLGVVPLKDSFCEHAMRDGVFLTADSSLDERLHLSPMKGVVLAYCGIPVLDRSGQLFGSLCHFDFVPKTLPADEYDFLQKAAVELSPYL